VNQVGAKTSECAKEVATLEIFYDVAQDVVSLLQLEDEAVVLVVEEFMKLLEISVLVNKHFAIGLYLFQIFERTLQ
jgi:hypothetical protein